MSKTFEFPQQRILRKLDKTVWLIIYTLLPQLTDPLEIVGIFNLFSDHICDNVPSMHFDDNQSWQNLASDPRQRTTNKFSETIELLRKIKLRENIVKKITPTSDTEGGWWRQQHEVSLSVLLCLSVFLCQFIKLSSEPIQHAKCRKLTIVATKWE